MNARKPRRRRGVLPLIAASAVTVGVFAAPASAALTAEKAINDNSTPTTVFDREWSLTKSVDATSPIVTPDDTVDVTWKLDAQAGESVPVRRQVVRGTVMLENTEAVPVDYTATEIDPAGAVCGLSDGDVRPASDNVVSGTIPAGQTATLNWACRFTDLTSGNFINTVSVDSNTDGVDSPEDATVDIDFANGAEILRDEEVGVADDRIAAFTFTAAPGEEPRTFTETLTVPPLGCETTSNTATLTQVEGENKTADESVEICRDIIAPTVTKTANGSWLRVFDWKLDKRADSKAGYNHRGHFVRMGYTIDAKRRVTDRRNFRVNGLIKINNPNTVDMTVEAPVDTLSQLSGAAPEATCALINTAAVPLPVFPQAIPAGEEIKVRYRCTFPNDVNAKTVLGKANAFSNTATVTYVDDVDSTATASNDPAVEVVFNAKNRRDLFDRVRVTDRLGNTIKILSRGLNKSAELRDVRYLRAPESGSVKHVNVARLVAVDDDGKVLRNKKGEPRLRRVARESVRIVQKANPSGQDPAPVVYSSEDAQGSPARPVKNTDEFAEEPTSIAPGSVVDRPERLRVRKSVVGKKKVEVGGTARFRIVVKNRGDEIARNVRIRDVLPRHLRAKSVRGKTRAVRGLNRRVLNLRLPNISPGKSRVVIVNAKVISRPEATGNALRIANRAKNARTRRIAIRRLEKGITCNVAIGRARAFRPHRDAACIKILPTEEDGA